MIKATNLYWFLVLPQVDKCITLYSFPLVHSFFRLHVAAVDIDALYGSLFVPQNKQTNIKHSSHGFKFIF